jgi:hypothetical protein
MTTRSGASMKAQKLQPDQSGRSRLRPRPHLQGLGGLERQPGQRHQPRRLGQLLRCCPAVPELLPHQGSRRGRLHPGGRRAPQGPAQGQYSPMPARPTEPRNRPRIPLVCRLGRDQGACRSSRRWALPSGARRRPCPGRTTKPPRGRGRCSRRRRPGRRRWRR